MGIAWAAGLFEGEGSISLKHPRDGNQLWLKMTDEDVVRRFHAIVGCGTVAGPKYRGPHKPIWAWQCSADSVIPVLKMFAPFFGERRSAKMADVLAARQEFEDWATRSRICPSCSKPFRPAYSRGASSRVYCTRKCQAALFNRRKKARLAASQPGKGE